MPNSSDQLEEMKALISFGSKCLAYSTLLHFQEQSSGDPTSIQALAGISQTLLSLIVADISDDDEEIAALALKCLGFMIYHPSLVAVIAVDDANLVIESIVRLITTTKMKSVCNLGVWCISIQQFNAPFLDSHYNSVAGGCSCLDKASNLSERMRDSSHLWAPPIYRRLLSFDKERDMSERCLLKIKPIILPPPLVLSKVLVKDMKQILLTKMKELLNQGMKVQAIHAWGWFIRLLGSYAMKNRQLTNEMLKIPENTFSDLNPQVQIASQFAWEGLIDALIHLPIVACETNASKEEKGVQHLQKSRETSDKIQANGFLKSIRLVMTPLTGIISNAVTKELQPATLESPLYKLDLKYIDKLQSINNIRHAKFMDICSIVHMNMVSLVVYLLVAYLCLVFQSTMKTSKTELILQGIHKYFKFLFSSYDPLETLLAMISLLYNYVGLHCLNIWVAIAKGLTDCIDDVEELSLLRMESNSTGFLAICSFLLYPFSVCSCPQKNSTSLNVYCSATNSFLEDLYSMLNGCGCLDEHARMLDGANDLDLSYKDLDLDLLSLYGNVVICFLEENCTSEVGSDKSRHKHIGDCKISSNMNVSLRFASRYLKVLCTKLATEPPTGLLVTSRLFFALACVISCLHMKQDILLFIESLPSPSRIPLSEQIKLDYPQSLLHVLDKLSRNGKINLRKRSLPYLERCCSRLGVNTALQRYRVTATHNMSSKRVEFVEDTVNQLQHKEKLSPRLKRKSLELIEHQKEVRRAQQGRERGCSGHGPGIRTYTSVDFSQGNEDSQESQEIRDPESVMEMLKRAT
uniref:Telomere-associated protein Rif1 N-terminal domain-containing protein n=1 Tax=Quercus lobata TaxID=97700 RepID=A0A7N2MLH5_QUELO